MSKAARANRVGRTSCRWGFIGAGKMASALVHGMLRAGIAPANCIFASDPVPAARSALGHETGITVFESNGDVVKRCDVLVLAVKPQNMSARAGGTGGGDHCRASGRLDCGGDHD